MELREHKRRTAAGRRPEMREETKRAVKALEKNGRAEKTRV
jgi:hypothetical protein